MAYALAALPREGEPKVLSVLVNSNNIVDLTHVSHATDIWKLLGYDFNISDQLAYIREQNKKTPFAITEELKVLGFDGARIPNSTRLGGSPETVIFDPTKLIIVDMTCG